MVIYDTTTTGSSAIEVGQSRTQIEKALGTTATLTAQSTNSADPAPPAAPVDAAALPPPTATYDPSYSSTKTYAFRKKALAAKSATNAQSASDSEAQAAGGLDFDACRANPKGGVDDGTVINHYNYCGWRTYTGVVFDSKGVSRGTIKFASITIGEATNGNRVVTASTSLRNFQFTGSLNSQVQVTMQLQTGGYNGGQAPNGNPAPTIVTGSQPTTMTAGQWSEGNFVLQQLTTDSSTGLGRDKINRGTFRPMFWSLAPGIGSSNWAYGPVGGNRWDSAPYIARREGVIFDRVTPFITYSNSSPLSGAVAYHINQAFQYPSMTIPYKAGKIIPGNVYTFRTTGLLHRSYSGYAPAVAAANRAAKDKVCQTFPVIPNTQCDEYPFASTREGAGLGDNNFSIAKVSGTQNQRAGTELGAWYSSDRILHDDAFAVRYTP